MRYRRDWLSGAGPMAPRCDPARGGADPRGGTDGRAHGPAADLGHGRSASGRADRLGIGREGEARTAVWRPAFRAFAGGRGDLRPVGGRGCWRWWRWRWRSGSARSGPGDGRRASVAMCRRGCQWPVTFDVSRPRAMVVCGDPVADLGRSYCPTHTRVAFLPQNKAARAERIAADRAAAAEMRAALADAAD